MYNWLNSELAPRHLVEAVKLIGTLEVVGEKHSDIIMSWADEVGISRKIYSSDEIPWCGLYIAVVMKRANRDVVKQPLWARSWLDFGIFSETPMLGDLLVFSRNGGGHVGVYVGEDKECYHVLGGNQSNAVNVTRIRKTRLIQSRRPPYKLQPKNVRIIRLSATGSISQNEA